jgi:hypothetical protein
MEHPADFWALVGVYTIRIAIDAGSVYTRGKRGQPIDRMARK